MEMGLGGVDIAQDKKYVKKINFQFKGIGKLDIEKIITYGLVIIKYKFRCLNGLIL